MSKKENEVFGLKLEYGNYAEEITSSKSYKKKFEWTLFVGFPKSLRKKMPRISNVIKQVEFNINPDYPTSAVVVRRAPFMLERVGTLEDFEVEIKVVWKDEFKFSRKKRVDDLVHMLSFKKSINKQVFVKEIKMSRAKIMFPKMFKKKPKSPKKKEGKKEVTKDDNDKLQKEELRLKMEEERRNVKLKAEKSKLKLEFAIEQEKLEQRKLLEKSRIEKERKRVEELISKKKRREEEEKRKIELVAEKKRLKLKLVVEQEKLEQEKILERKRMESESNQLKDQILKKMELDLSKMKVGEAKEGKGTKALENDTLFTFLKENKLQKLYDGLLSENLDLDDLDAVDCIEDIPDCVVNKLHRKKFFKCLMNRRKKEESKNQDPKWIKIAFVVGVSNYTNFKPPLKGSKFDSHAVTEKLKSNGFRVFGIQDVIGSEDGESLEDDLNQSFDDFVTFREEYFKKTQSKLEDKFLTFFYFAGHGLVAGSSQCLLPKNFDQNLITKALKITKSTQSKVIKRAQKKILENSLSLKNVVNSLSGVGKLIVILDCCRNEVKFNFQLEASKRSVANKNADVLCAFSTKVGEKAIDTSIKGENSPYTKSLLNRLKKGKGREIGHILRSVRRDVVEETDNNQEPVIEDTSNPNSVFKW